VAIAGSWRSLVFQSPRRLNLRLYYKTSKDTRLDVWPALPLLLRQEIDSDTVIGLRHSNCLRRVNLWVPNNKGSHWNLEKVFAAMQVPFPELTELRLRLYDSSPVIPDSFLGGSAPCLQHLELYGFPFPGFPNLLLSANHLVTINLINIPHSGYFSPEAMATCLSGLTSLVTLFLGFDSSRSRPDLESRSLPPPKRSVLPALSFFLFQRRYRIFRGVCDHYRRPST
jgi:hypothetical protein